MKMRLLSFVISFLGIIHLGAGFARATTRTFGMTPGSFARYELTEYSYEPGKPNTAFLSKIKYGRCAWGIV